MGQLTLNTTAQQDQRLSAAFGRLLGTTNAQGEPRGANAQEIRNAIITYLRTVVRSHETQAAIEAAAVADLDVS